MSKVRHTILPVEKLCRNLHLHLRTISTRTYIGNDGRKYCVVNETIQGRLQEKLMKAVMWFNINRE